MLYTFYVVDRSEEGEVRVYSAASFPSRGVAEGRAKEVAGLMGGINWGVEELKEGQ
jgi:hypothetical protein